MAASKSWSSGATTVTRKKVFTVAEANRTLPLVRRVVTDVVKAHEDATALHMRLEHRMPTHERDAVQGQLERIVDRLGDLIDELRTIGCELKDYRIGLIDFIGRYQGRDICLCWKLGEDSVEHWHELHAGIAGRQPISAMA